jgi:DNA-binding NarL/FixJ family response regulator
MQYWKDLTISSPGIDAVLVDIKMPIVNGPECASMIWALQRNGSIKKRLHTINVTPNVGTE